MVKVLDKLSGGISSNSLNDDDGVIQKQLILTRRFSSLLRQTGLEKELINGIYLMFLLKFLEILSLRLFEPFSQNLICLRDFLII